MTLAEQQQNYFSSTNLEHRLLLPDIFQFSRSLDECFLVLMKRMLVQSAKTRQDVEETDELFNSYAQERNFTYSNLQSLNATGLEEQVFRYIIGIIETLVSNELWINTGLVLWIEL
jgi:hypothetical protein